MARTRLKIDQLAKLRQFTGSDDPSEFLSTQWRQVIRALEQSYVELPSSSSSILLNKEFYAIDTNVYTGSNDLTFSTSEIVNKSGTIVNGNVFRPLENGKFWIEALFQFRDDKSYSSGTWTSQFKIKDENGNILKSNDFIYQYDNITGISHFSTTSSCCVIAELTKNNGVLFNCVLSHASLRDISFKIKKIG